ncbi:helix-turn-helix transcriptional regulator [Sphingobacterium sp. DR205]|nr:helix-turn-helix transcriptional regulator [Sphingobacterium sp. DR205]
MNVNKLRTGLFDALAKKCGLSKGGIIHHFPAKEAIFVTLIITDVAVIKLSYKLCLYISDIKVCTLFIDLPISDGKQHR